MKKIIGIDLGGMSAKAAMLDENQLIGTARCKTDKSETPEETARHLADLVREVAQNCNVPVSEIAAVGIGSPGLINSRKGIVVEWSNFGWKKVPLASLVQKYIGLPVCLVNDANAAALGEYAYGAGKDYSSAVLVTIGTGVGGGIIFDGEVFEGNLGAGAELGHEVIRMGGEKCSCGRRGCFEAYASASALIRQTRQAMLKDRDSAMWKLCGGDEGKADGKTAFDAVRLGDKTANSVVKKYLKYLTEGLANIANVFRPQAIILGGGICAEGETLTAPLQRAVARNMMGSSYAPVKVVTATLGNAAGIYGSAEFARRKI